MHELCVEISDGEESDNDNGQYRINVCITGNADTKSNHTSNTMHMQLISLHVLYMPVHRHSFDTMLLHRFYFILSVVIATLHPRTDGE